MVLGPLATAADIEAGIGELVRRCRAEGGIGHARRLVSFQADDSHLLTVQMRRTK